MADSDDARAIARQHTAQLLKMLRGYGPSEHAAENPRPASARESAPAPDQSALGVNEANPTYVRSAEAREIVLPIPARAAAEARPAAASPLESDRVPAEDASVGLEEEAAPAAREASVFVAAIASVGETLSRQRGTLGELVAKAKALARQRQIFQAYLPPHLRDHAELIRLDEESWEVHTDSASWATRLRYALHNIREPLGQQLGMPLPKPHIRVVPTAPPPPPRPRLKLTKRNARLLEATASNLADERLSAALRRLAAHARPPPIEALETGRR